MMTANQVTAIVLLVPAVILGVLIIAIRHDDTRAIEESRAAVPNAVRAWASDLGTHVLGMSCRYSPGGGSCDVRLGDGRIAKVNCYGERCELVRFER